MDREKKVSLILVTGLTVTLIAACGGKKEKKTDESTSISSKVEDVKVEGRNALEDAKDSASEAVETGKGKTSEAIEKGKDKVEEGKTKVSKSIEGASKELESSEATNN